MSYPNDQYVRSEDVYKNTFLAYKNSQQGRGFTDYRPNTLLYSDLIYGTGIRDPHKLREYLQLNGMALRDLDASANVRQLQSMYTVGGPNTCVSDADCAGNPNTVCDTSIYEPRNTCKPAQFPELKDGKVHRYPVVQCLVNEDCPNGTECDNMTEPKGYCKIPYTNTQGQKMYLQTPEGGSIPQFSPLAKCNADSDCHHPQMRCVPDGEGENYCLWTATEAPGYVRMNTKQPGQQSGYFDYYNNMFVQTDDCAPGSTPMPSWDEGILFKGLGSQFETTLDPPVVKCVHGNNVANVKASNKAYKRQDMPIWDHPVNVLPGERMTQPYVDPYWSTQYQKMHA